MSSFLKQHLSVIFHFLLHCLKTKTLLFNNATSIFIQNVHRFSIYKTDMIVLIKFGCDIIGFSNFSNKAFFHLDSLFYISILRFHGVSYLDILSSRNGIRFSIIWLIEYYLRLQSNKIYTNSIHLYYIDLYEHFSTIK